MRKQPAILMVANWDSDVGYAWWLMESYWSVIAGAYASSHRVLLVFPSIGKLSQTIQDAPLDALELDMRATGVGALWRQFRFLKRNRVRLIYFSDWGTWRWRYLLYRMAGVRVIITHDHTPGLRQTPNRLKLSVKKLLNRIPGLAADGAFGATEFVRKRLVEVNGFPAKKAFAIPNGLPAGATDVTSTTKNLQDLFGIPAGRKIIVMAARASRYKGVDFVLECIALLHAQGRDDLHFLFLGDGPDLAAFREVSRHRGISQLCSFPGARTDVPLLLPMADIAIHPSKGEVGYSLSILEYMRAGLPVVVPDNPSVCGATEHGETGIIYPEGDLRGASQSLAKLISDETFARSIGERAREVVQSGHSLADAHKALSRALEAIDRRTPPP